MEHVTLPKKIQKVDGRGVFVASWVGMLLKWHFQPHHLVWVVSTVAGNMRILENTQNLPYKTIHRILNI